MTQISELNAQLQNGVQALLGGLRMSLQKVFDRWPTTPPTLEDGPRELLTQLEMVARALESDADLRHMQEIFESVDNLREMIASAELMTDAREYLELVGPEGIGRVTRHDLDRALHRCRWMQAQVQYVMYPKSAGFIAKRQGDGSMQMVRTNPIRPPAHPDDWNGDMTRSEDGDLN